MKQVILKYALQNAVQFNGKANPGAVIGKVLSENPRLKSKIKGIAKEVNAVIKEVSRLSLKEQEAKLKTFTFKAKKAAKKPGLPSLKKAGKVIMRFSPSPSGSMHIGHAYLLSLNSEYCRKYKGKLILRIEDTNPENIYEPAYEMLKQDADWLTKNNVKEVVIQSDRLGFYYDYAEKLVDMGKAYVCTCNPDDFRTLMFERKECPCRNLKGQDLKYAKMFSSYKPGQAVLRLKTDINHKNPAMRDFPLMRINIHPHPRTKTKHRVWPLMNLAVFVDDVESGITHILRAKDHMDNARRQEYLYNCFNKPIPETLFVGKINFKDIKLSSSETKKLIQEGKYKDWSDIRLPFIQALKRRGYQPEAFIKYALDVGMTQNDKTVSKEEFFKSLNHFNKEILEPKANRYFFIDNPKKITIQGAPKKTVSLALHPDYPKRGKRTFKTNTDFYIAEEDLKTIRQNQLIRLMDCLNFIKKGNKFIFHSEDYEVYKEQGGTQTTKRSLTLRSKIIHWLPVQDLVDAKLLMPDKTLKTGVAEPLVKRLEPGSIIQFERMGFCRLDTKHTFWFAHR